jgi:hypothetical protein
MSFATLIYHRYYKKWFALSAPVVQTEKDSMRAGVQGYLQLTCTLVRSRQSFGLRMLQSDVERLFGCRVAAFAVGSGREAKVSPRGALIECGHVCSSTLLSVFDSRPGYLAG